jgi:hypothetical protein
MPRVSGAKNILLKDFETRKRRLKLLRKRRLVIQFNSIQLKFICVQKLNSPEANYKVSTVMSTKIRSCTQVIHPKIGEAFNIQSNL